MKTTKILFSLCMFLLLVPALYCQAQVKHPVKWTFNSTRIEKDEALITGTAVMQDGWHIYSQFMEKGGPLPTKFTFQSGADYSLIGKVNEGGAIHKFYDSTFMLNIAWLSGAVTFTQRIKLNAPVVVIKGKVEFMACTGETCLPPVEVEFTLDVRH